MTERKFTLSTIVAEVDLPLHVMVIDFPQNGEPPGVLPNC
jgi:hypothetical protein